jgi:hypothetical protein
MHHAIPAVVDALIRLYLMFIRATANSRHVLAVASEWDAFVCAHVRAEVLEDQEG